MRTDIVNFIKIADKKYGPLEAFYLPIDDIYVVTKNGRAVQNFKSFHFYQVPKYFRMREWGAIIKVGMNHNAGERGIRDQIYQTMTIGKRII